MSVIDDIISQRCHNDDWGIVSFVSSLNSTLKVDTSLHQFLRGIILRLLDLKIKRWGNEDEEEEASVLIFPSLPEAAEAQQDA